MPKGKKERQKYFESQQTSYKYIKYIKFLRKKCLKNLSFGSKSSAIKACYTKIAVSEKCFEYELHRGGKKVTKKFVPLREK